jgi:uncharacterized membrane protein
MKSAETEIDELGLERLIFFSDAVFAIAITLLALDIRLPEDLPHNASDAEMLAALGSISSKYFAYVLSFIVIGIFWIGHHRVFRYVRRYNRFLLLLNLLLLMFIAFIPFPTALIGAYTNRVVLIVYALTLAATGFIATSVRWYVSGRDVLRKEGVDLRRFRVRFRDSLLVPTLFMASALAALWSVELTWILWIAIMLTSLGVVVRTSAYE